MICLCELVAIAAAAVLLIGSLSKAPYKIKMVIFLLGSGISVLVCIPFMIFRPRDYRNALIPSWCNRALTRLLGVTMEVRGLENVQKEHGSVVLINHQSILDLCVLAYLWPVVGRATVVSKREVLYLPFFGFGSWLWGTLFINRKNHSNSINSLNKEAKAIKERNCKLLLFPEGTRNPDPTLLPFKKGAFHIAIDSQSAVQPVVVSHYSFLDHKEKLFKSGHVIIHILPEIETTKYNKDSIDTLITECRDVMQKEYKILNDEMKLANAKKIN